MPNPLQSIHDLILDGGTKGIPLDQPPLRLGDVGAQGWSLLDGDLAFPVAILHQSVLQQNAAWMRDFLSRTGTSICPHGKTTMAPQLFHRQLEDGAWGITLATPQEVRVAYDHGVKRILLANELTEPSAIRWVRSTLDSDPGFEFTCLVDSLLGVRRLASIRGTGRPLAVLLELGIPGGRTGVRSLAEGLAVARAVEASAGLALQGVECFEGIIITQDPQADEQRITAWLDTLGELARGCASEDLFQTEEVLLSAGGSAYFDLVVRSLGQVDLGRPTRVLLRSGCYLSHDAGHYRRLVDLLEARLPVAWHPPSHLAPALEVWGQVLSRPEPGLAFLNLGKRDVAHDLGLPRPAHWFRKSVHDLPLPVAEDWRITTLYDQHAKLEFPVGADLDIGDLVGCAISHPCTTFDKWQVVFMVDDRYRVVEAVKTFF
jgi:D-serine dehydratase